MQIHDQRLTGWSENSFTCSVNRFSASTDVFKVGEAIEEFATDKIKITIAIEVMKIRGRATKDIDGFISRINLYGFFIRRRIICAFIAVQINKTMQWPIGPFALVVECIIPAIERPIFNS